MATVAVTGVRAPALTGRSLLVLFGALHAGLLAYDLAHPGRFLLADRAGERIGVINAFRDAADRVAFIGAHGIPGDWLPQGLLYLAGGQYFVIAVQAALALLSILWVRDIAGRAGLGERGAFAAAALYGLLPQTLVFPHQLATEALFDPLVILSFRLAAGTGAGAALGAATLIRPITIVWPLIVAAVSEKKFAYLAAAFAPVLGWMLFVLAATGEFSLGRSSHDLGHNLYERMQRIASTLPEAERPAKRPPGETSVRLGEYVAFTARHPVAAALHSARDMATLGVKSGIERLALDYFDAFPGTRAALQDSDDGWRAQVERHGFLHAFAAMAASQPGVILVSAAGAVLFAAFMALAVAGAWHGRRNALLALLAGFVLYIFVTAQAVDAAQSRHRAPAEFALAILAVAGWLHLRPHLRNTRRGTIHGR
jgi:hypothetical protein